MQCPWCRTPINSFANDGGSMCCHKCAQVFHECKETNAECVRAPDGKRYALGSPGPLLCPHCDTPTAPWRQPRPCPGWD